MIWRASSTAEDLGKDAILPMVLPSTWSKSQNPGSVKGLGEMWSDMLKSLTASLEHAREELQRESIPEAVLIVTGQLRDGVESATSLTRKTVVDVILPLGHSTLSLMRKKASQITARDDLKPMLSYLNKVNKTSFCDILLQSRATRRYAADILTDSDVDTQKPTSCVLRRRPHLYCMAKPGVQTGAVAAGVR